jgi:hypothetical protein
MSGVVHRFYCARCDRFMYGETLEALAAHTNYHATAFHPADFAAWNESNIPLSSNYGAPPSQPLCLPEYTEPFGTTSRRGSVLPVLTDEDKNMLAEAHIRWD